MANRNFHGTALKNQVEQLERNWNQQMVLNAKQGFSGIISDEIKPIYLQVDLDSFTLESLRHWGIEVISEEDNGFIMVFNR